MTAFTLNVSQLTCYRDERLLFSNLNFSLAMGQGVFISGPNGTGKSTLLRILAGLFLPNEGRVCWNQAMISDVIEEYRKNIAYLGHKAGIKLGLTVKENLKIATALNQSASAHDNKILLQQFNLQNLEDVTAQKLSAGQKQRLALVGLLQSSARLWLLDEPLTALDNAASETLQGYLQAHIDQGGMLVMASHQPLTLRNMTRIDLGQQTSGWKTQS